MEERNALTETLSAPVSREQASGDLLAEIADIHDMAISRDGNTLYAAIENTNSIVVFDLGQKKILHTFTAPIAKEKSVKHCGGCKDQGVRSLALSLDEKLIYATSFEANALSVINVATGEIIQSITTGAHPDSFILSRDGTKAWVMNRTSNSVSAIDLVAYQHVADIPLEKYDGTGMSGKPGAWVMALSPDEKHYWFREQAEVTSCGSIPSRIRKKTFPQVMRVVSFLRWDSDQKMVRLFLPIARGFHV